MCIHNVVGLVTAIKDSDIKLIGDICLLVIFDMPVSQGLGGTKCADIFPAFIIAKILSVGEKCRRLYLCEYCLGHNQWLCVYYKQRQMRRRGNRCKASFSRRVE